MANYSLVHKKSALSMPTRYNFAELNWPGQHTPEAARRLSIQMMMISAGVISTYVDRFWKLKLILEFLCPICFVYFVLFFLLLLMTH